MAYNEDQNVDLIETNSGNQMSGINLDATMRISDTINRVLGKDESGVEVCFDLLYSGGTEEADVKEVKVRRGHAKTEYGTLETVKV